MNILFLFFETDELRSTLFIIETIALQSLSLRFSVSSYLEQLWINLVALTKADRLKTLLR